jgi:hypothetical protein
VFCVFLDVTIGVVVKFCPGLVTSKFKILPFSSTSVTFNSPPEPPLLSVTLNVSPTEYLVPPSNKLIEFLVMPNLIKDGVGVLVGVGVGVLVGTAVVRGCPMTEHKFPTSI